MDAIRHKTNDDIADGEIVWFWRPKAGAKFREMTRDDGGNKVRSPGRSRISRKTVARGMPAAPAEPVVLPRAFFVARGPWVQPAPGIPCALDRRGDNRLASGRTQIAPRRRRRLCASISVEGLDFPAASGSNPARKSKRHHAV
jgi:hypothetical protein